MKRDLSRRSERSEARKDCSRRSLEQEKEVYDCKELKTYVCNSALASFSGKAQKSVALANLLAGLNPPKEEAKKPSFFFADKTRSVRLT